MSYIKEITGTKYYRAINSSQGYLNSDLFESHTVVMPGILMTNDQVNQYVNRVDDGAKILVPDNTAAFIFSELGIEHVIKKPGLYEYRIDDENNNSKGNVMDQVINFLGTQKESPFQSNIGYINTREIDNIKFGTHGPLTYHDIHYNLDLEIYAYGNFSIAVTEPELFIRNFVPNNIVMLSLDNEDVRAQLLNDFLQSFAVAIDVLSKKYPLTHTGTYAREMTEAVVSDPNHVGSWPLKYGIEIVNVNMENVELSDFSKDLIKSSMMKTTNFRKPQNEKKETSISEQIEILKGLKELLDEGVLTQKEFEAKKKEVMKG